MLRVAFLILLLLPTLALAELSAEKCVQKSEHTSFSFLLVDLSDKISDSVNFKRSISVIQNQLKPGERVMVGISTDKVGDVKLLMDLVIPESSVWVSKLKIQALQKTFKDCLNESISIIESFAHKYDSSAILETLGFIARIFKSDSTASRRLFLYSDMMQNSPSLSFYKQKTLESDALMALVKKESLLPELPNVDVVIAGIGSHESDKKVRELENFWKAFFEAAQAKLNYFGPVLINY